MQVKVRVRVAVCAASSGAIPRVGAGDVTGPVVLVPGDGVAAEDGVEVIAVDGVTGDDAVDEGLGLADGVAPGALLEDAVDDGTSDVGRVETLGTPGSGAGPGAAPGVQELTEASRLIAARPAMVEPNACIALLSIIQPGELRLPRYAGGGGSGQSRRVLTPCPQRCPSGC